LQEGRPFKERNVMKNTELPCNVRGLASLVLGVVVYQSISWAPAKVDQKPSGAVEWKSVADVFGFPEDVVGFHGNLIHGEFG
jgi:hypothetical protein